MIAGKPIISKNLKLILTKQHRSMFSSSAKVIKNIVDESIKKEFSPENTVFIYFEYQKTQIMKNAIT